MINIENKIWIRHKNEIHNIYVNEHLWPRIGVCYAVMAIINTEHIELGSFGKDKDKAVKYAKDFITKYNL